MSDNTVDPEQDKTEQDSEKESRRKQMLLGTLGLIVLTVAAFSPVITAGYIWDDDDYVYNNSLLVDMDGLYRIWTEPTSLPQYYPLVHTFYWLEYRVWGIHPFGYHVVNLIMHCVGVIFLWRALHYLQVPGAWLAAAVFAVHPVQVESVAWVAERKNVLSGAFFMASLWAYLRFALPPSNRETEGRPWAYYGVACGLFVLALLSKTVTATLPGVLLLILWWKRDRLSFKDLLPLIPMFVVGTAAGIMTAYLEADHVGASGQDFQLPLIDRCLVAGRALWFYAYSLFWPFNLAFNYGRWEIDSTAAWQYVFPVAVVVLIVALFVFRKHIGRGPLAAVLAFCGMLFPALGFLNVYPHRYAFVADHFQYHACAALIVLFTILLSNLCSDLWRKPKVPFALAGVLLLAVLATVTWQQSNFYRDAETLYRSSIRRSPNGAMAHNNLGVLLYQEGEYIQARMMFEKCVRLDPIDRHQYLSNIGLCYGRQGSWRKALKYYEDSLELQPEAANVLANYGMALLRVSERREESVEWMTKAVQNDPTNTDYRYSLAQVLATNDRTKDAVNQMLEAVRIEPDNPEVRFALARVYALDKNLTEAIRHCEMALRVREVPQWVVTIGGFYFDNGELEKAIEATDYGVALARQIGQVDVERDASTRLSVYLEQRALRQQNPQGPLPATSTGARSTTGAGPMREGRASVRQ